MQFNRRDFLKVGGSSFALAALAPNVFAQEEKPAVQRKLRKAIMLGTVGYPGSIYEKFKAIKEAGIEGVEPNSHMDTEEVLKAATELKLGIPSVCCSTHWKENLGSPNPAERERGLEGLKQALRDAKKYEAKSVLLVPAVVKAEVPYDVALKNCQAEIRKAIPLSEELGVKIAIENVWNNFLLSPLEMARFIDDFNSPQVGVHFDIGNILRYGWPEQWVSILGKRILQIHLKEFSQKKMNDEGLWKGFQVQYLEGSNNWPAIMKALDQVGFEGWAIAEPAYGNAAGDAEKLKNVSERMDRIITS